MTVTDEDRLPLAAEFPPATREQWLKLVEGVLRGAPFEKKLVSHTHEGLRIEPLYARDAGAKPVVGRAAQAWAVMQRVDHPDPAAANAEALHDLENGASGLTLVFAGSIGARGFGIQASEDAIGRVLEGVHLDAIPIELDLSQQAKDATEAVATLVRERGMAPASTRIRFGFDPLGAIALSGANSRPWPEIAPQFSALIGRLQAQGFAGPHAAADGRVIHDAGGSEAQELAFVLAVAVAYLRVLEAGGMPLDHARHSIFFRLSADADQFLTMAKFRALRKLWARVEEACGLLPKPTFVSAETAWRMMTRRDSHVNMLRTTVAAFAAGLAGADAVSVLPFTTALGLPDRFARRIARNTQLILLEESNLAKVGDPAAGSGAFEDLTRKLCETAWALFQDIERTGGAAAALESGLLQAKVAEVRRAREAAIAKRKDAITGTSAFPNIAEAKPEVLMPYPAPALANLPPQEGREKAAEGHALSPMRLAEPFEALRDASDRVLEKTGTRPRVFLATLGSPAEFTARATFAKNFFEAGGIEAVLPPLPIGDRSTPKASGEGEQVQVRGSNPSPSPSPSAPARPLPMGEVNLTRGAAEQNLLSSFAASCAQLACLCSSDEVYAREAVEAVKALSAAGARHIYLAGRPKELEAALRETGVSEFIYAGCDALTTIRRAHATLGLSTET